LAEIVNEVPTSTVLNSIDGHNRRWIDGSILMLSIDTIGHADH
jgi:hypothetical protein